MAADFEVREETRGDARVLSLSGELDLGSRGILAEAISAACADGAPQVILDIRTLDFIDSTGLREIVAGKAQCDENGCRFQITAGRPRVERVFEVAGLLELLEPYRTELEGADQQAGDAVET